VLARAKVDARAVKMALYGFIVSAPLSHVLVGELQKAFAGRTGRAAKLGQVLASNLIVSPIQTFCKFLGLRVREARGARGCRGGRPIAFFLRVVADPTVRLLACLLACLLAGFSFLVYLASLSVIGGAKSWGEVKKTVKGGFFPVIRVCFRSLSFVPCASGFH